MCAISGILTAGEEDPGGAVAAMSECQAHRGPDDAGQAVLRMGGQVLALGFRRLSIQDLSEAGHQPMVNAQTGSQIIFNGEIYNVNPLREELEALGQSFRGHSDTEVLLYGLDRWGPKYLSRVHGMYAIAFYDAPNRRLLLARDPLGIKPLYIARVGRNIIFSSEVRGILASGMVSSELDVQAVTGLLAYGAVQQPTTLFRQIRSFAPGTYQIIDADGAVQPPVRFWSFPGPNPFITETEAVVHVRALLEDAVRDHLIGDVPVGVFLSSGIDSTVVAATAARFSPHIRSFTVGVSDEPDFNELELARRTAKEFGLNHTEVLLARHDVEEAAKAWMSSLDQPSVDGLNVYVISRAVRACGITVALSGQGGDELFGGYPSFVDVARLRVLMKRLLWIPAPLRRAMFWAATMRRSEAVQQKMIDIASTDGSVLALYLHRRRVMSDGQLAALGITPGFPGLRGDFLPEAALDGLNLDRHDTVHAISQLESLLYQGNMLLRDGDANSMQHGLELRVPLLDQRLIDYVYTVPGAVRMPSGGQPKHLLRRAFSPELRPEIANQRKRGFALPIGRWMCGPLREMCQSALKRLREAGFLRAGGVDQIWESFLVAPDSPIWSRAFALVVLGCYLETLGRRSPPQQAPIRQPARA